MEEVSPTLLDFDPTRTPPPPRDAATVVVLRDGAAGLEVFCVVRHANSGFLGGALVFPGGKVDPADGSPRWAELATEPPARAAAFATEAAPARKLAVAACRETLEEGGILPVDRPVGAAQIEDIMAELAGPSADFASVLERRGLRLALDALAPFGRWVTPEAESRRYDARFFLLQLPEGQIGRHDRRETTMSLWATPGEVLARFARGELFLAPPTTRTLELLASVKDVAGAMRLAERQSLEPVCPRFVAGDGTAPPYLALPGDPSHEVAERRVEGPTRFVLRDARFVSEEAEDAREAKAGAASAASAPAEERDATPAHAAPRGDGSSATDEGVTGA